VLASPDHAAPIVYSFVQDPHHRPVRKWDWFALGLSALKIVEIFVLWELGARNLCWTTAIPWAHFFLAALILQGLEISQGYRKSNKSEVDILAGKLPTAKTLGGERKILLETPRNYRHHPLWTVMWIIGCLVCIPTLIATYLQLGNQAPVTVYSWVAFQLLWLLLRLVLYHVLRASDDLVFRGLHRQEWNILEPDLKNRAVGLLFTLAKYQNHMHPEEAIHMKKTSYQFTELTNLYQQFANVCNKPCRCLKPQLLNLWTLQL
jgi:hypothetical protein